MTSASAKVNQRVRTWKGNHLETRGSRKGRKWNKHTGCPRLLSHLRQEQVASHFLAGVVFGMSITDFIQFRVVRELLPDTADQQEA